MINLLLIFWIWRNMKRLTSILSLKLLRFFHILVTVLGLSLSLIIYFHFKSICFKTIILLLAKDSAFLILIQVRRGIHKPQLHLPNISSFHLSKRFCMHIGHYLYSCNKQGSKGGIHTS